MVFLAIVASRFLYSVDEATAIGFWKVSLKLKILIFDLLYTQFPRGRLGKNGCRVCASDKGRFFNLKSLSKKQKYKKSN